MPDGRLKIGTQFLKIGSKYLRIGPAGPAAVCHTWGASPLPAIVEGRAYLFRVMTFDGSEPTLTGTDVTLTKVAATLETDQVSTGQLANFWTCVADGPNPSVDEDINQGYLWVSMPPGTGALQVSTDYIVMVSGGSGTFVLTLVDFTANVMGICLPEVLVSSAFDPTSVDWLDAGVGGPGTEPAQFGLPCGSDAIAGAVTLDVTIVDGGTSWATYACMVYWGT